MCAVASKITLYFNRRLFESLDNLSDYNRIALKPLSSLRFRGLRFYLPYSPVCS